MPASAHRAGAVARDPLEEQVNAFRERVGLRNFVSFESLPGVCPDRQR
jgi:hypothetical protein